MKIKSVKYLVVIMRVYELDLSKALNIRIFDSKLMPGSDEFYEAVESHCNIGNMDNWQAMPIQKASELKTFSHMLAAVIKRIDSMYAIMHEQEVNKNQIPLPIEGEE